MAALAAPMACVETVTPGADERPDAAAPLDVTPSPDAPDVHDDLPDAAADGSALDQPRLTCAGRTVLDLDLVGISTAGVVRYLAATSGDDAPLETWACGTTLHPVVFRVTVQAAGRLRVSTDALATSVAVYDGCPDFSPPELSCLPSPTMAPWPTRGPSVAPERAFAVGDTVYVVVGSVASRAMFTLSVSAGQPIAREQPCDLRGDTYCADGSVCFDRHVSGEPPRCTALGGMGAPCRVGGDPGAACDPGLSCDPIRSNVCVPALARDAPCDNSALARCPSGQTCVSDLGPSDAMQWRCRDDGTAGGRCRSTLPRCDAGTACSGYLCQRPLAVGDACDARRRDLYCGESATCQGAIGASRCVADGALDGRCRTSGTPCDPGANCARSERVGSVAMCRRPVANGELCDPEGTLNACPDRSLCARDGTAFRCAAEGAAYGRCRASGAACDAALQCGSTGRCALVVGLGEYCDHARATWICAPGLSCELDPRGNFESPGICREMGTLHVACRAEPSPCDPGLACTGRRRPNTMRRCEAQRAPGESCSPSELSDACVAGTTCGPLDATRSACIADGALGGACRATGSVCDAGLACSMLQRDFFGRTCIAGIAPGETCRVRDDAAACATGTSCLTVDGALRCVVDGIDGGRCRDVSPRCADGFTCGADTRCRPTVGEGGPCDVRRERDACAEPLQCISSLSRAGSFCALAGYAEVAAPDEAFVDACDGGARLFGERSALAVVQSERVALPFVFRAYGTDVREVQISTSGVVSLGPEPHLLPNSGGYGNFPWRGASVPMIAAYWDYLARRSDGVSGVCVRTVGTAPHRRTIIGWNDLFNLSREATHLTFAVVLHEGSGVIDVRYAELRSEYGSAWDVNGGYGAMGVQGRAGLDATAHRALLTAPMAIRYAPR